MICVQAFEPKQPLPPDAWPAQKSPSAALFDDEPVVSGERFTGMPPRFTLPSVHEAPSGVQGFEASLPPGGQSVERPMEFVDEQAPPAFASA